MAGYHAMTPARRAALRKAQIASANKRRKYGVGSQVKRAARQQVSYRGASANVAVRRHVGSKGFQNNLKKAAKYSAVGLGAAAVVGAAYKSAEVQSRANAVGTTPRQILKSRSNTRKSNKNTRKNLLGHNVVARKSRNINRRTFKQNRRAINKQYSYRRKF